MFIFWTHNNDVKRRMFGKKVRRFCTKCNHEATFYECDMNNSVKIMGMFALWDKHESVLQCGECLALFKTDEQISDTKSPEQQEKDRAKRQAEDEKRQAEEAKRQAEEARKRAEELARQEAEAAARLAEERQAREAAVDAELAELKKKMGK